MPTWDYPALRGPDGRVVVVEYHDGDTVRLALDAGCETAVFPWLRVAGVNCPELSDPGGSEAAEFLRSVLDRAERVDVHITGRSFARWVASVSVDGDDLAGMIVDAGHGVVHEE
ncbi:thermonuclease family protein [Pseudonocardia parietis]|uniref:Endonuclease YncB(Thermonuclease family) n=1 Tax=Pseudonocardia parietis TaxID=570936 RepID=A0ABS4W1X2_9PSEU|nr:hypothetical protein [Pseudonocardia parietis]MBP2370198.1 endonuclease YncB(thermonuclease family) [Pseudonocardia parietis]